MKKVFSLLLMLVLLFPMIPSLAESAYPACQGTVTDLADVLPDDAEKDFEKLSERYGNAAGGQFYVVTRHFLGGRDVNTYAQELFDVWNLSGSDALLVMVIGEESYALALGDDAARILPRETVDTCFGSFFHQPFMQRQYAKAAGDMASETLKRIAAGKGAKLNTQGLFGSQGRQSFDPDAIEQELSSMFAAMFEDLPEAEENRNILKEDKSTGISLWKVLLILIILRTVFKKRRRRNFGHRPYR